MARGFQFLCIELRAYEPIPILQLATATVAAGKRMSNAGRGAVEGDEPIGGAVGSMSIALRVWKMATYD
jgi:hypothetical protein